jgi:transcriptional regulator with XRE-family HTH domain
MTPSISPLTASEKLRLQRVRSGATQEEAAKSCGYSRALWNGFESGRATPSAEGKLRIFEAFGVPIKAWR